MAVASRKKYELLVKQAQELIAGENDWIANTANLSALLFNSLNKINFAGIYRLKNNELILGPFQGKPACIHILLGSGVCGLVAETKESKIVKNVHQFPGHIACDSASNSEIVVPIFKEKQLWGVYDFDSIELGKFGEEDQQYLEKIANLIFNH